jgi:hypothetical protein
MTDEQIRQFVKNIISYNSNLPIYNIWISRNTNGNIDFCQIEYNRTFNYNEEEISRIKKLYDADTVIILEGYTALRFPLKNVFGLT